MFDPSVYLSRRAALSREMAARDARSGLAVFPGNDESPIRYPGNCHEFRQDSSWLYFFGIPAPGLRATIDLDSGVSTLYCDEIGMADLIWTGPRPGASELAAAAGISAVRPTASFSGDVATALSSGRRTRYLPPYRGETRIVLGEALGLPPARVGEGADRFLIESVVALREIKEEREVSEHEEAVALTAAMHMALLAQAQAGWSEARAAALVSHVAAESGAQLSFTTIATIHGETLHTTGRSGIMRRGGLFLLDAGAESPEGYAGDLTTTFPVDASFSSRQAAIYGIVLRMAERAVSAIRPGARFLDIHLAAALELVLGLKDLGIMRGDPVQAVAEGAHALFFPHGLGHMIGLDVHDMEGLGEDSVGYGEELARSDRFGLRSLRLAKTLKPRMIHSVEPGIYFIPGLIADWKSELRHQAFIDYRALERWEGLGGIRNEEDWIVTDSGARRLGPEFDKGISAIEAARSGSCGATTCLRG